MGQAIAQYRILEKLGEGGMGVVYKARDTRLNRLVAVKALLPGKDLDPDLRGRFLQEARTASMLNHPHIVSVHDMVTENGCDFIVMEYLDGETLAQKIASKELRLAQILKYAAQIAQALACAHAAGIVHRDLKPSNVMIAGDGAVKVLDFGLAKWKTRKSSSDDVTETMPKTGRNVVLGTAGYMSPEQVRGKEVDARSDIFNLGLILYEMLSGTRAFQGESAIEVMNAVLKEEPRPLSDTVPAALRQIVTDCLEKEPSARFESARDVAFALRAIASGPVTGAASSPADAVQSGKRKRWLVPALASVAALGVCSAILYALLPGPLDLSSYKFRPLATESEPESMGAWSPDGKSVVYVKTVQGSRQVMVRSLDAPTPTQLTRFSGGVTVDSGPFCSPDGEHVYFVASGAIWSVAIVGGEPRRVLEAPTILGAAISPDGKALALWRRYEEAGKLNASVWISSPPGAAPRKYEPAPFRMEAGFVPDFLHFSRDGSEICLSADRVPGEAWIWLLPWPDGPDARPQRIFPGFRFREVTPPFDWMPDSRHIVLSTLDGLWMGDSRTGRLNRLTATPIGTAKQPSVSPDGRQVLFTAETVDYDAVEIPLDGSPPRGLMATSRNEASPSWSAAGDLLAFITDRSGQSEIWLRSASSGWERPIVRQSDFGGHEEGDFIFVALSPEGTRVAYSRGGRLWVSPVSGGRPSQLVTGGDHEAPGLSWSPDSSSVAYLTYARGNRYLAITRVGSQQPQTLLPGTENLCGLPPVWSPDGRWIACGGAGQDVLLLTPDGAQRRSLPSPVRTDVHGVVLVFSKDGSSIYVASSLTSKARLDEIDVRTGRSRKIVEYTEDLDFSGLQNLAAAGSLARDGKSFATAVVNRKSDLWILEGFPQPGSRWRR